MVREPPSKRTMTGPAKRMTGLATALACCMACAVSVVRADPPGPQAAISLERHWTSNALDSDRAVADWYSLLRGSLQQQWGDDDANAKFGAEFQSATYDTVKIEDDRILALGVEAFRRLSPGLELRGTLGYRVSSEGDDLQIGQLSIGTRRQKQALSATGQLGVDLGHSTALVVDVGGSFEKFGRSRFQDDLLLPAQLDPDRNRFQIGARLTRTLAGVAFGASASALVVAVESLGSPPVRLSLSQYTLRGEAAFTGKDGSALGLALGAEFLRGDDGIYSRLRPTWQVTFAKKLPHGFDLRGTFFGRYETADSDDPLASWLRRAEMEIGIKLQEKLAVASGVFTQLKQNLLFENEERSRGLYAEATYNATASTALVLRVNFSKTVKTVIDVHERTVDAFIGLRAKI